MKTSWDTAPVFLVRLMVGSVFLAEGNSSRRNRTQFRMIVGLTARANAERWRHIRGRYSLAGASGLLWFWNGSGRFGNRRFCGGLGWSAILRQLRGRHFSAGRVNEDLDGTPTAFRTRATLLPHSQCLEPPIIETEILNKVLPDHQGTTLGFSRYLLPCWNTRPPRQPQSRYRSGNRRQRPGTSGFSAWPCRPYRRVGLPRT